MAAGTSARELVAAVRARTEGTPYVLTETEDGFDVGIDLADATYYTMMYQKRLEKTFTYRVKLDEASSTMSITDDTYELSWKRGADVSGGVPVPTLGGRVSRSMGRLESKSFEKTYAVDEQGQFGKVVDYSFDSAEGRKLIREPAAQLGWREEAGAAQKIGVAVAAGAIVLVLVIVVLLLVML